MDCWRTDGGRGELSSGNSVHDISSVKGSVVVKDFSKEKFKMHLKSGHVNVIGILPGGVVTKKETADIRLDENGEFVRDPEVDIVKVAVVERHQGTGNVACGFLKGYGIKEGAVALSVAHDSHNSLWSVSVTRRWNLRSTA